MQTMPSTFIALLLIYQLWSVSQIVSYVTSGAKVATPTGQQDKEQIVSC